MHEGAQQLPIQHISIRVPWHDSDWNGTICKNPEKNLSCRALPRIASLKNDIHEMANKGRKFSDLPENKYPPCISEQGSFMAPFPIETTKRHPYTYWNLPLVKHFLPTKLTIEPYSVACVPLKWMRLKEAKPIIEQYKLGFNYEIEPKLDFNSPYIQDRKNHQVMLETFYSALKPHASLCFFYAKDTPLSSTQKRTIIGVGLVEAVGEGKEYNYTEQDPKFRSMIWERNVKHTIRPDFKNGIIFPYRQILELAEEQGFDPEEYLAFVPDDANENFSWGTELVTNDQAISTILICLRSLDKIIEIYPENKLKIAREWLNQQLNQLWHLRGAFPGFGSVLSAFLKNEKGNLIAYDLISQ